MDALEPALAIGVLVLVSVVATNAVLVPAAFTTTSAGVVLLIAGLLTSVFAPTLAVVSIVLAIVVFYKRNIQHTVQGTLKQFEAERAYPETSPEYGDRLFPTQATPSVMQTPGAESAQSGPREYTIDGKTFGTIEGFAPATVSQSMELNPPKGQFPTDEPRETAAPVMAQYMYRPDADTGSNDFKRYGPQMDQKVASFRYYN
jgi:hypothetical protein